MNKYIGGGWQGGVDGNGKPRGISLAYAMEDILGMKRHYRYDTIEPGVDGVLDTQLDTTTDDVLSGNRILPGENGWIDTQPVDTDVLQSRLVDHLGNDVTTERAIIAGVNGTSDTTAMGDDVQEVVVANNGLPYGTQVVSAGPNGVLDTPPAGDDLAEYVGGFETSRTCVGNVSTIYAVCKVNSDCNTATETNGSCTGSERISRIDALRAGDYNRDWFVLMSEAIPTSADFNSVTINKGQIYRLAFMQDLDKDGLSARTEAMQGSIDSGANLLDNTQFGKNFDLAAGLAAGPGNDLIADSRDSDHDGLSDYAEIKVGWLVNANNSQTRVFPHPGMRDTDGDGLTDLEEMDVSSYCVTSDSRSDGLCRPGATAGTWAVAASNPRLKDTDNDRINDLDELSGYSIGEAIVDGGNGIVESSVNLSLGDDIALLTTGAQLAAGGVVIAPGADGLLDVSTTRAGDDLIRADKTVVSDPLRAHTDNDGIKDGYEKLVGGDPTVADRQDYTDTDEDGLTDTVETDGWKITLNGNTYHITSNPNNPDSDGDGLPDLVEKELLTVPMDQIVNNTTLYGTDTDQDKLTDYQEFTNYARYTNYSTLYPQFSLVDDGATHYATSPIRGDSDGDTLLDGDEVAGILSGDGINTYITNELKADTDGDYYLDNVELNTPWTVSVVGKNDKLVWSDPTNVNADGDAYTDLFERYYLLDPTTDNTDGDVYGIPDDVEHALGTNPKDPLDRCVKASVDSISYVDNYAARGVYIDNNVHVNWVNYHDQYYKAGTDLYVTVPDRWFSDGWTRQYADDKYIMMKLGGTDKVYFNFDTLLQISGVAWTEGWKNTTDTVLSTVFDGVKTLETRAKVHTYGDMKVTTNVSVMLINDPVVYNCK